MTVNRKSFGLKNENAHVFGRKNKDQYMLYQNNYREQRGVFPELDMKNQPFTALWDDPYNAYAALKKRGFYGAWFWHDYHGKFNKKLKKLYHTYKREWSFLCSINFAYRTILNELSEMEPQERIVDDLGYRKDEQGNYYEGTWENGNFVYGLMYIAKQNVFCVGGFKNGLVQEFHGVCTSLDLNKKNEGNVSTLLGIFQLKNGELSLYQSSALILVSNIKKGELKSVTATVGDYDGGYENGRFYTKTIDNDNIRIGWDRYVDGEVKANGGGVFDMLLHFVLGMYMMPYYMMKFTYGLLIWPIYRAIQKSNWQ